MKLSIAGICVFVLYALLVSGVVWSLFAVRERELAELDTPEAHAAWLKFKQETIAQSGNKGPVEGPVQRAESPANEPPTLVLLRDHFVLILAAAIVFSSVIFGFLTFVIHGMTADKQRT